MAEDKENRSGRSQVTVPRAAPSGPVSKPRKAGLSARWQFDAALLSQPIDLSALVTLSQTSVAAFTEDPGLLNRMVDLILNSDKKRGVDKDSRLDVLVILGNIARDEDARAEVQRVLETVSSWFDEYMHAEESGSGGDPEDGEAEPELHKAMLVLLCRAYNYSLQAQDVLELCGGDRVLALETVVGLLEDGEQTMTEIEQKRAAADGQRAVWEQKFVSLRYEKPLIAAICSLLRGFTHPDTYFQATEDGFYFLEAGVALPTHSIEKFSEEIETLLAVVLRTHLVEKLAIALHDCLFADAHALDEADHFAVAAVHEFILNLYQYAMLRAEEYRSHLLCDTLLVPHLILPYLDQCVAHANVLVRRAQTNRDALSMLSTEEATTEICGTSLEGIVSEVADIALDYPALTKGIAASLRTLVIASFRAPRTRVMFQLLSRVNPTFSLMRCSEFMVRHDFIFSLVLQLNVNMGAFDTSMEVMRESITDAFAAFSLLQQVAGCYAAMGETSRQRVLRRFEESSALPLARDTPSYAAVLGILWGGGSGQLEQLQRLQACALTQQRDADDEREDDECDDDDDDGLDINPFAMPDDDEIGEALALRDSRAALKLDSHERITAAKFKAELAELAELQAQLEANDELDATPRITGAELAELADAEWSDDEDDRGKVSGMDAAPVGGVMSLTGEFGDADRAIAQEAAAAAASADQSIRATRGPVAGSAGTAKAKKKKDKAAAKARAAAQPRAPEAEEDTEAPRALRLLGDLPSLEMKRSDLAGFLTPDLQLPGVNGTAKPVNKQSISAPSNAAADKGSDAPRELRCAINGHLMRDPVRSKNGTVYERSTIELWLRTRGSVCPITNEPLTREELTPDPELRTAIMRFHIKSATTSAPANGGEADADIYDF